MRLSREEKMKSVKEMKTAAATAYLLEELVIENILTRLPLRTLAQYSCISKLWYNLISKDARFAKAHFVHNKNHNLNLLFNISVKGGAGFFSLDNDYKFRLLMDITAPSTTELVGYCNGLACVTLMLKAAYGLSAMIVVNPVTKETLTLPYYIPINGVYLGHGFGFDSSTGEYKVVMIYYISRGNEEFISMVYTLGTNSWRNIVTSIDQISAPGCSPFPSRMATTAATLCGGDLFWRITRVGEEVDNSKIGLLLPFDIHKEKIQIIGFPIEGSLTPTPPTLTVVVEHHILEYRGYTCVAQSEKLMRNIMQRCCHLR
ncbi:putative F-box protein At1g33530 [Papaver somniferum]|uniref:putative F-box protein At1g33530 n=1 Tax=Papaver somniferum TaxID=3469 RepID=UPI000E703FCF|nr:putative F-box protein At1g33530 [Papaver somniferum]XP_026420846.1 putative F-box protein At1g33530 [Papaver somniferum]XP_026420847.1 putative F-box protein At1g33530 [Papaver somniferum]XP_026420848.1 putative F-box protein At1g33530 [Papaver somniferum]XP_026420849.1 putative F-box protein At1g33530 [Papaver somniferum]